MNAEKCNLATHSKAIKIKEMTCAEFQFSKSNQIWIHLKRNGMHLWRIFYDRLCLATWMPFFGNPFCPKTKVCQAFKVWLHPKDCFVREKHVHKSINKKVAVIQPCYNAIHTKPKSLKIKESKRTKLWLLISNFSLN